LGEEDNLALWRCRSAVGLVKGFHVFFPAVDRLLGGR
jgi:hypothetical protein